MGIAIAVKTGRQAACPSIIVFIPAVCLLTAVEHYIKCTSIKYCTKNLLIKQKKVALIISLLFRGNHLIFLSFLKHLISLAALVATISSNPFATQFTYVVAYFYKRSRA